MGVLGSCHPGFATLLRDTPLDPDPRPVWGTLRARLRLCCLSVSCLCQHLPPELWQPEHLLSCELCVCVCWSEGILGPWSLLLLSRSG